MNQETKDGLGVAFNEATLLGVEFQPEKRLAAVTLSLLTLPADDGPPPEDPRVSIVLHPVGRVAVSLREGRWDDRLAAVTPLEISDLLEAVQSFGGLPIYGWEFFDRDEDFATWSERLSLDVPFEPGGMSHSLVLFQEGANRHLDMCIWFDELRIYTASYEELHVGEVIAGGERWWKAMHEGDQRTHASGIVSGCPASARDKRKPWWRMWP